MTLDEITLPDDLEWTDEIIWTPIAQDRQRSATGSLLIQESTKIKGMPITLKGQHDMAWITRSTVNSLMSKRNTIGLKMTLTINNTAYTVMFRQNEEPIDVKAIRIGDFFSSESYYKINTLKFVEVE